MFKVFSKRNQSEGNGLIYELPQNLRRQVIQIWDDVAGSLGDILLSRDYDMFYARARKEIRHDLGEFRLVDGASTAREEVAVYFLNEENVAKCLDIIEIV